MSTMLAVPFAFDVAAAQVLGAADGAGVERGRRRQRRLGHRLGQVAARHGLREEGAQR